MRTDVPTRNITIGARLERRHQRRRDVSWDAEWCEVSDDSPTVSFGEHFEYEAAGFVAASSELTEDSDIAQDIGMNPRGGTLLDRRAPGCKIVTVQLRVLVPGRDGRATAPAGRPSGPTAARRLPAGLGVKRDGR